MRTLPFSRRNFLRSAGFLLGLPAFESLLSSSVRASAGGAGVAADGSPLRVAFVYAPNGAIMSKWTPLGQGSELQLNDTMLPLHPFRSQLQVVTGLEHQNGWAGPDGGGDHARATATILTGARPKKTAGNDIRAGVSVDQVAARHLEGLTRLPSLELSCDGVRQAGTCDSGYSCAYQFNLSWRSETQPMAPESNPRQVFERLFGRGTGSNREGAAERHKARERSLLDFVMQDAVALEKQLGRNDQRKLDEYLTGVRELEKRVQLAERFGIPQAPEGQVPTGVPVSYKDHLRIMFDMLALAFQTDSTRVATFLMAHDGSNRNFPDIGVTSGHHELSHHQEDPKKIEQLMRIDRFYTEQLAYFLGKLQGMREPNGKSVLDNSMVVYCGGLSDANKHSHNNLPAIIAGRGGGVLRAGQHLALAQPAPMTNLYLALLQGMGLPVERIGDSTGVLPGV
jgi:hypothetical protein